MSEESPVGSDAETFVLGGDEKDIRMTERNEAFVDAELAAKLEED